MIRAQQALDEILLIGIDEEPPEVLMHRAQALIEKFKSDLSAAHRGAATGDEKRLDIASELAKLRDAVDQEIDRRVDEDLADSICDLLEHLSGYLHAETADSQDSTSTAACAQTGLEGR
jgi:hypothetical protein